MSKENRRILICAGGTGGHVFPAKKVAEIFLENNFQVEWIGTGRGPEKNICDNLGIKFHQYQLAGFSGKSLYQKTKSLFLLFFSILKLILLTAIVDSNFFTRFFTSNFIKILMLFLFYH